MSRILVKTRTICDFCVEGKIQVEKPVPATVPYDYIICYHCGGVGHFERWDDLQALVQLALQQPPA